MHQIRPLLASMGGSGKPHVNELIQQLQMLVSEGVAERESHVGECDNDPETIQSESG